MSYSRRHNDKPSITAAAVIMLTVCWLAWHYRGVTAGEMREERQRRRSQFANQRH